MIDVINSVPFGSDNALSIREIWRTGEGWSETTVGHSLNKLAESGAVRRRQQNTVGSAYRWLYWREASAA